MRSGNAFTLYRDGTNSLHDQDPNSVITISSFPTDVYLFAIVRSDPNMPTPPVDLDIDAITLNSGTAVGAAYEEDPNTLHRWEYENPLLPTAVTLHAEPSAFAGLEKTIIYDYDDPGDDADPNTPNSAPTVKLHRMIESGYTDEDHDTTPEPILRVTAYIYYGASDPDGKFGQLQTIDGPVANDTVTFTYGATGQLATVTNALGQSVTFAAYDQYGRSTRTINLNGDYTQDTESRLGQILSRTFDTEGLNLTSTREYADELLLRSTSPKGSVVANAYDEYRRLESMERRASAEGLGLEKAAYEYNFRGQRTVKELRDAGNSLRYSVTNGYGQSVDPNDSQLREFVSVEAPSDSNDVTTTWLDALGRPRTRKDPTGHATRYDYDARGRLQTVTEKHVSDGESGFVDHVTHYAYDNAGNLVSVTDPEGLVTTYVYDDFKRLLEVESPDSGTTQFEYDLAGRMTSKTQAVGTADEKSTLYAYDDLGRLRTVSYETPGRDAEYFYDGHDPNEATSIDCDGYSVPIPQNNAIGRLSAVAVVLDPNSADKVVTTYEYDSRGLLLVERKYVGASTAMVTSYAYDEDGNATGITYPSGREVAYGYDPNNPYRVSTVTSGLLELATDIVYEPFGGLKEMHLGNGMNVAMGYDEAYRLTAINTTKAPYWYLNHTYDRDARGNIEQVNLLNNLGSQIQKTFEYDEVSRLTSATGPWGSLSYRFDKSGNRMEAEGSEYSYDGSNQIVAAGNLSMSYNGLGNLVQRDADFGGSQTYHSFGFSPDDRLGQVTRTTVIGQTELPSISTTFLHMPDGLRLQKNDDLGPPVVYHHDRAGNLLSETYVTDPSGEDNPNVDYVYLGRHRLALIAKQGESGEYLPGLVASAAAEPGAWYAVGLTGDRARKGAEILLAVGGISTCILMVRRRYRPVTVVAPIVLLGIGALGWLKSISDARADALEAVYYFMNGHLGEPLALFDSGGDVVWSTEYKPYGELVDELGSIGIGDPNTTGIDYKPNFRFPGQYEDRETGLVYNHWRYYQPGFGNYTQPDPLGIAGGGPNIYAYVLADPVNLVDSSGLWVTIVHIAILYERFGDILSPEDLQIFLNASWEMDRMNGPWYTENNAHGGLANPGQGPSEAQNNFEEFLCAQFNAASDSWSRENALFHLGMGLHGLADSTSPSHEDNQVYPDNIFGQIAHASQEAEINPEELERTLELLEKYYEAFMNNENCSCGR